MERPSDGERVEDAGDDLAHAESDGFVLGGGEVEEESEKRFAEIVALRLHPGRARGGEGDDESNDALRAEVALMIEGGDRAGRGGRQRRERKSLRIGVHHANAVVWGPV